MSSELIIICSDDETTMEVEIENSGEEGHGIQVLLNPETNFEPPAADDITQVLNSEANNEPQAAEEPRHDILPETEREPSQNNDISVYDDDGQTCPICLDGWTTYGEHRVCSLRCGHLFGLSCVQQWFLRRHNTCPTCKKKSYKNHIRYIYARKLVAMDTSEYENLKTQYEQLNKKNNNMQIELTKSACREQLLSQQVAELKKEISTINSKIGTQSSQTTVPRKSIQLYKDKSMEMCNQPGCRVLDYCSRLNAVFASLKSPNSFFPGFGVRRIDVATYKPATYITLHSKSIRDISIHPCNPWLLTVSLDNTIKIVDLNTNLPSSGYMKGAVPLWACCWDSHNSNIFFTGNQQGVISKFDMRHINSPVSISETPQDRSAVVSLAPVQCESVLKQGGIIVCKLNSLALIENDTETFLPMEGPFISMKYENSTNHLLLSCRANSNHPTSRHIVATIESNDNYSLCNTVQSFPGSAVQTLMSRSCFVNDNTGNSYVAAYQESVRSVSLWNISNGQKACALPAFDHILDVCSFNVANSSFLVSLTDKRLDFFKFA